MSEKRRALGRGLGALIPGSPTSGGLRPVDVFFADNGARDAVDIDAARNRLRQDTADVSTRDVTAPAPAPSADAAALLNAEDGDRGSADGDALAPVFGARFAELPVHAIQPNRRQPRTQFDEDELAELTHSIAEIGVLQPIVVRQLPAVTGASDDPPASAGHGLPPLAHAVDLQGAPAPEATRFELVMGERRWRATMLAGLETIPAIIRDTEDDALLRDALLENLHRSQLNPLEEAAAYQQLLDDFGGTHDELASRLGRSRPQISNTIRLLRLPPLVARRVAAGVLSAGHARALLSLSDGAAMERLAQRIVAEGLSVRSVEEIVTLDDDPAAASPRSRRMPEPDPELDHLAAELSDRFDTRVRIAMGRRRGRLSVEFASVEDLQRIVALWDGRGAFPQEVNSLDEPGRHASPVL